MNEKKDINKFLISKMGKFTITIISALIIFGIIFACLAADLTVVSIVLYLACAYFGWIFLEKFTLTHFFRIMSGGTIVYLVIKFFASCVIGAFVAPFQIGKIVSNFAMNKIDNKQGD